MRRFAVSLTPHALLHGGHGGHGRFIQFRHFHQQHCSTRIGQERHSLVELRATATPIQLQAVAPAGGKVPGQCRPCQGDVNQIGGMLRRIRGHGGQCHCRQNRCGGRQWRHSCDRYGDRVVRCSCVSRSFGMKLLGSRIDDFPRQPGHRPLRQAPLSPLKMHGWSFPFKRVRAFFVNGGPAWHKHPESIRNPGLRLQHPAFNPKLTGPHWLQTDAIHSLPH
jgi:hypothetical protein